MVYEINPEKIKFFRCNNEIMCKIKNTNANNC